MPSALDEGRAVVALESTIFSHLGLPSPANREALERCTSVIRSGRCDPRGHRRARRCGPARADGRRTRTDPRTGPQGCGTRHRRCGRGSDGTSVRRPCPPPSPSPPPAGVKVFATGGIGGVHRGSEITGDISADLDAIASHPVVTVSAGAKAFLDLPRTLEFLEAAGVPVLGWQHDWFPAFYTRSSGLPIPHRVESADEVARIYAARSRPIVGNAPDGAGPRGRRTRPGRTRRGATRRARRVRTLRHHRRGGHPVRVRQDRCGDRGSQRADQSRAGGEQRRRRRRRRGRRCNGWCLPPSVTPGG